MQVRWRKVAGHAPISYWWLSPDSKQVQFSRGRAAMFFMNVADYDFVGRLFYTQLPPGVYCNVLKDGCEPVRILSDGSSEGPITVAQDGALALHVNATEIENKQILSS